MGERHIACLAAVRELVALGKRPTFLRLQRALGLSWSIQVDRVLRDLMRFGKLRRVDGVLELVEASR